MIKPKGITKGLFELPIQSVKIGHKKPWLYLVCPHALQNQNNLPVVKLWFTTETLQSKVNALRWIAQLLIWLPVRQSGLLGALFHFAQLQTCAWNALSMTVSVGTEQIQFRHMITKPFCPYRS